MSEPSANPRAILHAAALLLLLSAASGCALMHAAPKEATVIHGKVGQIFRVDSEHGSLNGVTRPEIVYDLYLDTHAADSREYVLWVTHATQVYRREGGDLRRVPFETLRGGEQLEAHVGEIDRQNYRPGAYAVKLVILD